LTDQRPNDWTDGQNGAASGVVGRFDHLSPVERLTAELASKPRLIIYFFTAMAVVLAWVWLLVLASGANQVSPTQSLGPGMEIWRGVLEKFDLTTSDNAVLRIIAQLCAPQSLETFTPSVFASTFAMWFAMSLAMMLPSAAPLLRTYGDIADVAAQKGETVVSLSWLVAGYLTVWLAFCAVMTAVQLLLVRVGLIADPVFPVQGIIGGLLLVGAGAFQFSELKNACLEKCRNPFSYLFGRWSQERFGVFKMGIEQGLFCLGCCWALMLVMLVVGTMNLAWMAFFTLFAIVEKSGKGKVTSHISGGILVAWGGILLTFSIISM